MSDPVVSVLNFIRGLPRAIAMLEEHEVQWVCEKFDAVQVGHRLSTLQCAQAAAALGLPNINLQSFFMYVGPGTNILIQPEEFLATLKLTLLVLFEKDEALQACLLFRTFRSIPRSH